MIEGAVLVGTVKQSKFQLYPCSETITTCMPLRLEAQLRLREVIISPTTSPSAGSANAGTSFSIPDHCN